MARGTFVFLLGVFVIACGGCGKSDSASAASPSVVTPPLKASTFPATPPAPTLAVTAMHALPVLARGGTGKWDSLDVLNPSVVEFRGKLINYYSGWDGVVWRTGYATSTDNGLTWTKRPAPVLSLQKWTTKYIAANGHSIVINNQIYHYFQGETPDGHQQIGLATSSNGITFAMLPNPVVPVGPPNSRDDLHTSDPYVIKVGNEYWMYYSASPHDYKSFTMARATSKNGITWVKDALPLFGHGAVGDYDEVGDAEPSVVYQAPYYYMVFTAANGTGQRLLAWASSIDGKTWKKQGPLLSKSAMPSWAPELMCDPTMMPTGKHDGTFYVWFGGGTKGNISQGVNGQIGRMTVKLSVNPSSSSHTNP